MTCLAVTLEDVLSIPKTVQRDASSNDDDWTQIKFNRVVGGPLILLVICFAMHCCEVSFFTGRFWRERVLALPMICHLGLAFHYQCCTVGTFLNSGVTWPWSWAAFTADPWWVQLTTLVGLLNAFVAYVGDGTTETSTTVKRCRAIALIVWLLLSLICLIVDQFMVSSVMAVTLMVDLGWLVPK